jgi:hypothetical protein
MSGFASEIPLSPPKLQKLELPDDQNGLVESSLAPRDRLGGGFAAALDRLMRSRHEFLEVHTALRRVMHGLEEEIEQHCLAAPNPAIE